MANCFVVYLFAVCIKVNVFRVHDTKVYVGTRGIAPQILTLALDRSGQLHAVATLPLGKHHSTH